MSAHTPGPWKVVAHPKVARVESMRSVGHGANGMASVAWLTGGALNQEANARLIAAAPDLLAALKDLLAAQMYLDDDERVLEAEKLACAAISKAEGKS